MTETRMQKSECRKQDDQSYSVLSLKVIFPNMTLPELFFSLDIYEAQYFNLKTKLIYLKERFLTNMLTLDFQTKYL